MKYGRTFNFSAGPAMMPEPVLEEIRDEMMNYRGKKGGGVRSLRAAPSGRGRRLGGN